MLGFGKHSSNNSNYWKLHQILIFSIFWASGKWSCSNWDVKSIKVEFITSPKTIWKFIDWGPTKQKLKIPTLMDLREVGSDDRSPCWSCSTRNPLRCHLSVVRMIRREGKCKVALGEQVPIMRNNSSGKGVLHHIFVVGVGTFFFVHFLKFGWY